MGTTLAAASTDRWHVTIDRADAAAQLRDYFRRLGLSAEVSAPTLVELQVEGDGEHDIEEHVLAWHNVNGIALHLAPATADAAPATAVQPLPLLVPPPPQRALPRIGELLVGKGMIGEDQLAWALGEARATSQLLGVVLLRENLIFEDELARTLSQQLSLPYVSVGRIGVNAAVVRLLPPEVGAAAAAIPIRMIGASVQVGFADPTDPEAQAGVRAHLPDISLAVSELSDIKMAWHEFTRRFR